jgi:hypothetical protein
MPRYRAGRMEITILGSVGTTDYTLRDFSNLFRSAANMSVFVVIRGIRTPTVARISIIGGKGCDVTFLALRYGLPSLVISDHIAEDLLNETETNSDYYIAKLYNTLIGSTHVQYLP